MGLYVGDRNALDRFYFLFESHEFIDITNEKVDILGSFFVRVSIYAEVLVDKVSLLHFTYFLEFTHVLFDNR